MDKCSLLINIAKMLFALIITGGIVTNLSAQDSNTDKLLEMSLDELMNLEVNVGSSKSETIFSTPSSVSIIDQQMISKFGFRTVSDAIGVLAGVSNIRTHLKRDVPVVRGILSDHYANKVLVMINGVPAWISVTGEANLNRVDISHVERIEVLKGPASVVYGTNAYSGAINIVLKNDNVSGGELNLGYGSYDRSQNSGHFSWADGDESLAFYAGINSETGKQIKFTDESKIAGHLNEFMNNANLSVNYNSRTLKVLFNTYKNEESYLGLTPNFSAGAGNAQYLKGYLASAEYKVNFTDIIKFEIGTTFDYNQRILSRTLGNSIQSDISGYRAGGFAKFFFDFTDDLSLEVGTDYDYRISLGYENFDRIKDSILAENNLKNQKINEFSIFSQLNYSLYSFTILGGVRYTKNEKFGNNVSARGTLLYSINESNSLKLIAGQSYRAPSLFELYFLTNPGTVYGNIDLEPEMSNSIELSYLFGYKQLFMQATIYHAIYNNKIMRVQNDETSTKYINGSEFSASGIELEATYRNPNFADLIINYSYISGDSGDEYLNDNHYNFKYVPQHTVTIGASKCFGEFTVSVLVDYITETKGALAIINSQINLDLNISYRHKVNNFKLKHNISCQNVTDEEFLFPEYTRRKINEVPSGYGRSILYTLSISV